MNVQLDTNILTRLAQPSHPFHAVALEALRNLQSAVHVPCVVPQNLFEFWAVATRRVEDNGLGLSVAEAKAELETIKNAFVLFLDSPLLLDEWEKLVIAYECKGKAAHDARIVAAMNIHGTKQLLTFNVRDFVRYTGVTVLDAASLGCSPPPLAGP
jgi:predicted nucleic acid-binding protein